MLWFGFQVLGFGVLGSGESRLGGVVPPQAWRLKQHPTAWQLGSNIP